MISIRNKLNNVKETKAREFLNSKSGFTIMEIVVATTIFTIASVSILDFLIIF